MKSDDDLEETIRDVNKRKNAAPEGSAAHRFAVRELEACLSTKWRNRSWRISACL